MAINFLAGECHFAAHLYPIWEALPRELRGRLVLVQSGRSSNRPGQLKQYADRLNGHCGMSFNTHHEALNYLRRTSDGHPVVTASVMDLRMAARSGLPQVFCEHGAGQTYSSRHPSYAGGANRPGVALFLCPNERVAGINRTYYPRIPAVVIGCPKLDRWHRQAKARDGKPVVAISFHWECLVTPETRTAFPHFQSALPLLAKQTDFKLLGHGHPRIINRLRPFYREYGIDIAEDFREVLDRADLYCCDNSSTLFEFASTGRPVVLLNAPWYRRDIHHGLRFWDAAGMGRNCDEPGDLLAAIYDALATPDRWREQRNNVTEAVYPIHDGTAAQTAAEALIAFCHRDIQPEVTSMAKSTAIPMMANRGIYHRGRFISDGAEFEVDSEREALRLETTKTNGVPWASRIHRANAPDPAPVKNQAGNREVQAFVQRAEEQSVLTVPETKETPVIETPEVPTEPEAPKTGVTVEYICPVCGKRCTSRIGLTGHMRSHKE
jgi:hypothetical protein